MLKRIRITILFLFYNIFKIYIYDYVKLFIFLLKICVLNCPISFSEFFFIMRALKSVNFLIINVLFRGIKKKETILNMSKKTDNVGRGTIMLYKRHLRFIYVSMFHTYMFVYINSYFLILEVFNCLKIT